MRPLPNLDDVRISCYNFQYKQNTRLKIFQPIYIVKIDILMHDYIG